MEMEIKVYGSEDCPYCRNLKKYLKILRVPYNYVDVDDEKNEKEYLECINVVGHSMIPLVKINENYLSPDKEFNSIPEAVKIIFSEYKKSKK